MSIWKVWVMAFSNVHEVVSYVTSLTPILAIAACLDAFQSTLQAVVRGCGWQKLGTFVNLGFFYLAGIPLSVVLAFVVHMKGLGLLVKEQETGDSEVQVSRLPVQNVVTM
ncbi:unnamed protein product [Trifolium pratense]|uniref:Uncharacterized protein n=1 Tax=Trifolium pratense TaxID=57577 RepID=A0ACB0J0Z0_TRIPR|nr:unnamed protein product [Trifolium pratense]